MYPSSPPQRGTSQGPGDLRSYLQNHWTQTTLSRHVHLQCRDISVVKLRSYAGKTGVVEPVWGALFAPWGASEAIVDGVIARHLAGFRRGIGSERKVGQHGHHNNCWYLTQLLHFDKYSAAGNLELQLCKWIRIPLEDYKNLQQNISREHFNSPFVQFAM